MAWVVLRARSNVQPNFIILRREGPSILTAQPPHSPPREVCIATLQLFTRHA